MNEWEPDIPVPPEAEIKIGPLIVELAGKVNDLHKAWTKRGEVVFQAPLYGQLAAGSYPSNDGANSTNSNLSTDRGLVYSVRRLSATGFTAGTVIAYINAIEPIATWVFGAAADPTRVYAKGAMLLQPGDRITLGGTGITGQANIFGVADAFPTWYLPEYLD